MKKLVFSAAAVVAIVSSALAFNPSAILYIDDPAIAGADCLQAVPNRTVTVTPDPEEFAPYNTVPSSTCLAARQLYFID